MAGSEFLPYQDANGDGLIDACDEVPEVVPEGCPECKPNPNAIVTNWRKRDMYQPYLNEKNCKYQITKVTGHTTTNAPEDATPEVAADELRKIYDEHVDLVLKTFLESHNKDTSDETIEQLKASIEYVDWDLDPRPKSRLKLLYSIPFEALNDLEEADSESDEEDEEEEEEETDIEVTYEASELESKLLRVRKGLHLYSRNLKVYRAVDNGNILFKEDNGLFNLDDYGDYGNFNGSIMAKVLSQLDDFLHGKGFNIPFAGKFGPFKEAVDRMTFKFDENYELKKLMVYTKACPGAPNIYIEGLNGLKSKSAWKDPTAMAYFAALRDMDNNLTSQVPMEWTEFIQTYTYPEVYATVNYGYDEEDTVGSCIGDALEAEGKQLGQDILDEAFSLGDAIAYRFHKNNICSFDIDEARKLDRELGLAPPADFTNGSIVAMAQMQAFQTLEESNPLAAWLCQGLLGESGSADSPFGFPDIRLLFDRGKICFLLDLLLGAIECLFSGLTLDASLESLVASALAAMSIEDFGKLFIGLPPEEQQAVAQAALEKLASKSQDADTEETDVYTVSLEVSINPPWEDEGIIEWERKNMMETSFNAMTPSWAGDHRGSAQSTEQPTERTLAPSYDSAEDEPDTASIMQVYIEALIDHYRGRFLELVDQLMQFPGAEVIAWALAVIDFMTCPVPPGPGWRWDLGMAMEGALPNPCPGCFSGFELTIPRMKDIIIPPWKDILRYLFELIKMLLHKLIVKILMLILVKVCELVADAICKALETVGSAAASLATGGDLKGLIRESICGEDVDDETLDNTIVQLFSTLGTGGASLSDQEQVLSFAQDISSAVTRTEMSEAFLGNPSPAFLGVVDGLIEHEYPDFRSGLKNTEGISSMFKNMGNLMPANFRQQLREFVESLPANDEMPANPSLCATPAELEEFCEVRTSLLEGRASPDQIAKMCEISTDDLGDLATIMQSIPKYIDDNMPPMQSDPGCDNGLLPYEPDEIAEATTAGLSGELENLKSQFTTDMVGNGLRESKWGMLNMVLSDTMGNPLTAHHRKAANRRRYVDFYMQDPPDPVVFQNPLDMLDPLGGIFDAIVGPPRLRAQKGAFPKAVASWLKSEIDGITIAFSSNNDYQGDKTYTKTFDDLGGRFGRVNILSLPDLGYNIDTEVDFENDKVLFIEKGRKADPDVTLSFEDNAKGLKTGANGYQSEFAYGFDLEMYLSDLVEDEEGGTVHNRVGDNVRIRIIDRLNTTSVVGAAAESMVLDEEDILKKLKDKKIIYDEKYEFLSVENTFDGMDLSEYPKFLNTFVTKQNYLPQIVLLKEMINKKGGSVTDEDIKSFHDSFTSSVLEKLISEVHANEDAFKYGAEFDNLSAEEAEYVVGDGQTEDAGGTSYADAEVKDDDGDIRGLRNRDMIFGMSKDQYDNEKNGTPQDTRIFYLNPATYGGSYSNPPVYVKPLKNKGWLGFVDVLFPELCPCKPRATDLIDFGQIQDTIDDIYPNIPEDARLNQDPDCVVELPYNRVLERAGTAGLQGLITAAIRIFATAHMTKSMATFTKFSPRFTEVFSSIYACYIIEEMEESFKDAQPDFGEAFSVFKDEEFWYAFLEQSVQMFARLVESGDITPSESALRALNRLNDVQEDYQLPDRDDLRDAKRNNEVRIFKTLKNYRADKNLEAIKETEEDAKLVLKDLVNQELNFIGQKFIDNLKTIDMVPDIYDLDYYLLENFTQGSSLDIDHAPTPTYSVEGEPGDTALYTTGGEFVVGEVNSTDGEYDEGEEYVGYYHVITGDDGSILYMVGEFPQEDEGEVDILYPMASMIIVDTGDVGEYPYSHRASTTQPFVIEKYVKINNRKVNPTDALNEIKANNLGSLISDVYPGSMELVYDDYGEPVGIEGDLGIRYGLEFSIVINGTKNRLTNVEIDALDTSIGEFKLVEEDTKLLLCLVNQLKEDKVFKLVSRYILALPNLTAFTAVYNDLAFLPSIGEVTVKDGQSFGRKLDPVSAAAGSKPGTYVKTVLDSMDPGDLNFTTEVDDDDDRGQIGWASLKDRSPGLFGGLFVTEWDNWDQIILRNSTRTIKKQFKMHYYNRDFDISDMGGKNSNPGQKMKKDLVGRMKRSPGQRILPRWRRRRRRTNPFNANGELCEKD